MNDITMNKRSVIVLFSSSDNPNSHRVRLLAKEKEVQMDVYDVNPEKLPEDLMDLNPYGSLPTLVDKDLALHNVQTILEYLDERFPHPPLMSVNPVLRARMRQMLNQIELEWYPLVETIQYSKKEKEVDQARVELKERFIQMLPVFEHKKYFMSDDYSLVDISLSVIIWRLPYLGINIPESAKAITDYSKLVIGREMFYESLTDDEIDMRDHI